MIKSFVFSFLIAASFLSLVVMTEEYVLADDKTAVQEGQEFALIKGDSVSLASEGGEETSDYPLLLGKDGTVADTAVTTVDITITDPNYSYEY